MKFYDCENVSSYLEWSSEDESDSVGGFLCKGISADKHKPWLRGGHSGGVVTATQDVGGSIANDVKMFIEIQVLIGITASQKWNTYTAVKSGSILV